jgi:hypothetical protein
MDVEGGSGSSNAAAYTMEELETAQLMRNTGSGVPQMTLAQANKAIEAYAASQGVTKEQLAAMEKGAATTLADMNKIMNEDIQASFTSEDPTITPDAVLAEIQKQFGAQAGGSRKYKQRGGATWADVRVALYGLGQRMAYPFVGAAGAAPDMLIAAINAVTLRNAAAAGAWGMAGYGVVFGPPQVPWLTEILWTFVANIPANAYAMMTNTLMSMVAIVTQSSLLAIIGMFAVFSGLLVVVLKTFADMAATGDRNFPRVLKRVLVSVCQKLGIMRANVATAVDRALNAEGNTDRAAAAAAATAGATVDETGVVGAIIAAGNVPQPQQGARRPVRRARSTARAAGGNAAAGGSGSGSQGGGRRRTRKHHSRRHKRRQSHRRRRISRRG